MKPGKQILAKRFGDLLKDSASFSGFILWKHGQS
jgi:hypothetical protein